MITSTLSLTPSTTEKKLSKIFLDPNGLEHKPNSYQKSKKTVFDECKYRESSSLNITKWQRKSSNNFLLFQITSNFEDTTPLTMSVKAH